MQPNAEKILNLLISLYAKQMGVKIEYVIEGLDSVDSSKVHHT